MSVSASEFLINFFSLFFNCLQLYLVFQGIINIYSKIFYCIVCTIFILIVDNTRVYFLIVYIYMYTCIAYHLLAVSTLKQKITTIFFFRRRNWSLKLNYLKKKLQIASSMFSLSIGVFLKSVLVSHLQSRAHLLLPLLIWRTDLGNIPVSFQVHFVPPKIFLSDISEL